MLKLIKSTSVISALTLLLCANTCFAYLSLTEGAFKIVGSDPSAEDRINEMLWADAILEFTDTRKVKCSGSISFTDFDIGGTRYTGNADLTLNGDFEEKDKRLSGNFTVDHYASYINEAENRATLSGEYNMVFSGTFTGGISEDGVVVLDLKGTKTVTGEARSTSGHVESLDDSKAWNSRSTFSGFTSVLKEGEEFMDDETAAKPELVISKVVGDITYSDPDKRAGIGTAAWRAITSAYQNDPEQWRKWEQPREGTPLKKGTRIKTDLGMAMFEMRNGTKFIMKRGSEIRVFDGGSIRIEKGGGYFVYPKTGEKKEVSAFDFKNVVRGTEFSVEVEGDSGSVKLVEGELEIFPPSGDSFLLAAGESYEFNKDGSYEQTDFDADAEKTDWDKLEAEAPDTVTSKVDDPGWIVLAAGILLLVGIILIVFKLTKKKPK